MHARHEVFGRVAGSVQFFRYRSPTKAGAGYWSPVVSLLMI
jgi:hypothetical protein